ncbi:hypothetical protein [Kitasatospora sp. NPDC057198]|uniref:hypothetical protein n=1 Tax=Kitasatospora sp. NPDC057198 TaxID=3346046 RepID=UPI00363557B9
MTTLILAWLVGEGLIIYREVARENRPPLPADLISTSGLFVLLALLAEAYSGLANTLAWGFVGAAFLNFWPSKATQNQTAQ